MSQGCGIFTLEKMAYNVLGNWRFASPNKGLQSKTRAGKMWVREAWERA
jgi:hypothetical protein